jgi:HD-like signal output (HDOD) protein
MVTTVRVTDLEIVTAAKELPGAPRLLVELGTMVNDPDTDTRDVTELLKQDPSLVARLIRMANSAAYGRGDAVSTIEGAVSTVGFAEVHRLVGALASTQLAEKPLEHYRLDADRLRNVSLFTAVLMEEMAKYAGESERRCYTVGLLRSIGMMTLQVLARQGGRHIPPFDPGTGQPIDEWEKTHWGLDNCEAAEVILTEWRLPHETVGAIRHHYKPAGRHNPIAHLLALAASAAYDRYQGLPGEEGYWQPTEENFRKAGMDLKAFQIAGEKAQVTFARLEAALG